MTFRVCAAALGTAIHEAARAVVNLQHERELGALLHLIWSPPHADMKTAVHRPFAILGTAVTAPTAMPDVRAALLQALAGPEVTTRLLPSSCTIGLLDELLAFPNQASVAMAEAAVAACGDVEAARADALVQLREPAFEAAVLRVAGAFLSRYSHRGILEADTVVELVVGA